MEFTAFSRAMKPFGGFPRSIFVRKEMKMVWSTLATGIAADNDNSKWVVMGSPGMGKSVLTVLLCFYLAWHLEKPVFLARQLKGEEGTTTGEVAICIYPNGTAEAYPSHPSDIVDLPTLLQSFGRSFNPSERVIVVLDGWAQSEIVGYMQRSFGGFDLLATSVQYNPNSQDTRISILLPAWNDADLVSLWGQSGPKGVDAPSFIEQLYYSGSQHCGLEVQVRCYNSYDRAS